MVVETSWVYCLFKAFFYLEIVSNPQNLGVFFDTKLTLCPSGWYPKPRKNCTGCIMSNYKDRKHDQKPSKGSLLEGICFI